MCIVILNTGIEARIVTWEGCENWKSNYAQMVCAAVIRTGILTNTNLNSLWVTTTSNRQLSAGRKTDILQGTVRLKNPTLGVYEYQHRTELTTKPCCRLLYPLSSLSLTTRGVYTYQHGTRPCCRLLYQLSSLSLTSSRVYTYQHGTRPWCRLLYQLLYLSLTNS